MKSHYLWITQKIDCFGGRLTAVTQSYYGWVIVAASTLIIGLSYGLMYSYSVFFKPIVESFQWDRTTVSSIYSISLVLRGVFSIGVGFLADRYGAIKITAFCGFMVGLGMILSGMVSELWHLYLTYALILSIGFSGSFSIGNAMTARWFIKNRAMALAIVSTGSGLGTILIVPLAERLIHRYDWSNSFVILGVASGGLIILAALLLKPPPNVKTPIPETTLTVNSQPEIEIPLKKAVFSSKMILLLVIFSMYIFCVQLVMIHLVNHATDIGINSLQAAGLISTIGIVSIPGRLLIGSTSDRIGTQNALIFCILLCLVALIWLFFCNSIIKFYAFAVLFGFAYGAEVPLIPLLVGQNFGIRNMATLIGVILFVGNISGGMGPLIGGKIYDLTSQYSIAFAVAFVATMLALIMAVILKRKSKLHNNPRN